MRRCDCRVANQLDLEVVVQLVARGPPPPPVSTGGVALVHGEFSRALGGQVITLDAQLNRSAAGELGDLPAGV